MQLDDNATPAGAQYGVTNLFGGQIYGDWATRETSGLKAQSYLASSGGFRTYWLFNARIENPASGFPDTPNFKQGSSRPLIGWRYDGRVWPSSTTLRRTIRAATL